MVFGFKEFDVEKSNLAYELVNCSSEELKGRYLKKNHSNQKKFKEIFVDMINKNDEDGNLIYQNISKIEGKNLNHIAKAIFAKVNNSVINLGYQVRMERIVEDLEELLQTDNIKLMEASASTEVTDYIKEITQFLVSEIMIKNMIIPLQQQANANIKCL